MVRRIGCHECDQIVGRESPRFIETRHDDTDSRHTASGGNPSSDYCGQPAVGMPLKTRIAFL